MRSLCVLPPPPGQVTAQGSAATPLATVFYEWGDFPYLGVNAQANIRYGYHVRTYVCTTQAVDAHLCRPDQVGMWFGDPKGVASSIQQKFLVFSEDQPIHRVRYDVKRTGYYCAAAVQLLNASAIPAGMVRHSNAEVAIKFENAFKGNLAASEWPRLNLFMAMTIVYIALTFAWLCVCYFHRKHILLTQYFIAAALGLALVDAAFQWVKYSYMNRHFVDFTTMRDLGGRHSVTGFVRFSLIFSSLLSSARDTGCLVLLLLISCVIISLFLFFFFYFLEPSEV